MHTVGAFGDGREFLRAWHAWRHASQRPALLHHVASTPWPQPASHWASVQEADLSPLAEQVAAQWWGLTPGMHRLAFERGQVVLTLWVGDAADASREIAWDAAPDGHAPSHAIVIGGGLAGASSAAALARRGWQVQVLDAAPQPAAGASALPAGLMAPHHSHDDNLLSRLTRHGVRQTLQQAQALLREGQDWECSGTLEHHLRAKGRPLPQAEGGFADWSRPAGEDLHREAGLPPEAPALWHAHAGWIRPAALVHAWLDQPRIQWCGGQRVARLQRVDGQWQALDERDRPLAQAPLVVLAAALGSGPLADGRLWLQPVRGQVSWGLHTPGLSLPPFPVNGNGHLLTQVPTPEGLAWMSGSSYGHGEAATEARPADDQANLERLQVLLPSAACQLAPAFANGQVRAWTGVRCASADRRPLVGRLAEGLWVSTAMGSRGLSLAALCAELLAAQAHGEPQPLPRTLAPALSVQRQLRPRPLSEAAA